MKKWMAAMLCVVLTGAMLAGCGSSEGGKDKEDKDAKSGKTWIVATDTVFKPFEYTDENNEFVGIDVDLLAAIAEDQVLNTSCRVLAGTQEWLRFRPDRQMP